MSGKSRPEGRLPKSSGGDILEPERTRVIGDDQASAELLLLDRLGAVRVAVDAALAGLVAPAATRSADGVGPRESFVAVVVELADAARQDARKADMLAEGGPW